MKKFLGLIIVIIFILLFNKTILSKIILFSVSKWAEKEIIIKNIEIDYSKSQIVLNELEVRNTENFYYKNILK